MSNSTPKARNKWCPLNLNPAPLSADKRVPSLLWYTSGYSTSFTKPPPTIGELRSKHRMSSSSGKRWRLRDVLLGRRKVRELAAQAEATKDQSEEKQKDRRIDEGATSAGSAAAKTISKEGEEPITAEDPGATSEQPDIGSDGGTKLAPGAGSHTGSEVGSHDIAPKSAIEEDEKAVAEEEAIGEQDKAGTEAKGAEAEHEDEAGKHPGGVKAEEEKGE